MDIPQPEHRRVDVLFPVALSDTLESALSKLSTRYLRGKVKLADLVDSGGATDANSDDVWCVDPRGLLTLLVEKDTYERVGLVGKRLPFKAHKDYFVIRLPLQKNAESAANIARRNEVLKAWDARRERDGLGAWNVVYCSNDPSLPEPAFAELQACDVVCQGTKSDDVHIPSLSLRRRPSAGASASDGQTPTTDDDDIEDWDAEMATLFEWIGMASLGSQRLRANDRVDPYAALYECPSPSYVGSVRHLRWSGFIGPTFLQSVVDLALASVKSPRTNDTTPEVKPFVAITAHKCAASPVSYISPSSSPQDRPARLPRADGEDTWCLFATPGAESRSIDWALVESLGQYDTRWG
ncbi:hypothetical protein C0991_005758 [Blastosporella zonata]|nr:hypothetical protein C0991_005758 [Blastosporella zonata]